MTSIAVAPRPMSSAHQNPRRAPSFKIVRLTGPTGIDRKKPLTNPVRPAMRIGRSSGIACRVSRGVSGARWRLLLLLLLFLNLMADLPGPKARADKTVDEVAGEKDRQHVEEDDLVEHKDETHEQGSNDRFGESAGGTQAQRFEAGILDRADHHRGEKNQN